LEEGVEEKEIFPMCAYHQKSPGGILGREYVVVNKVGEVEESPKKRWEESTRALIAVSKKKKKNTIKV
jgi:hypothetical protein